VSRESLSGGFCIFLLLFGLAHWFINTLRAAQKSAKAQQETVDLLREIAAILKSNEEKKP